MVINLEDLGELLGPLFADRPLAVFHLREVALRNTCELGKLDLGHPFFGPCPNQCDTW